MKRIVKFVALACTLLTTSCLVDEDNTVRTLQSAGYTNIRTGDYDYFMCSDSDTYSTHFWATNPAGEPVEGTVCCGLYAKGCTIRF